MMREKLEFLSNSSSNFAKKSSWQLNTTKPLTVFELNNLIKTSLEHNFASIMVIGEVSKIHYHLPSGHAYFMLKDNFASIKCALFKSIKDSLDFKVENGQELIIQGYISFYPERGDAQIIVKSITPFGKGAIEIRIEQLTKKLAKEGLFADNRKKIIPKTIRKVGILSALDSDALNDIIKISTSRFPLKIVVAPITVTGKKAAPQISATLKDIDQQALRLGLDAIVITRGGGTKEDLWAFNEELLVRTIANCQTPIITAIGHQQDTTLADLVADHAAQTPTAAGFVITPTSFDEYQQLLMDASNTIEEKYLRHITKIKQQLQNFSEILPTKLYYLLQLSKNIFLDHQLRFINTCDKIVPKLNSSLKQQKLKLESNLYMQINNKQRMLQNYNSSLAAFNWATLWKNKNLAIDNLSFRFLEKLQQNIDFQKNKLDNINNYLEKKIAKQPLYQGYALLKHENQKVDSINKIKVGQEIDIILADGQMTAHIIKINKKIN